MKINLLIEGGDMKPGPALAQKIGPLGINIGKIIEAVNKETASFKGVKVPVELDVDTKTKQFKIKVSAPPVSELLKKELSLDKGSGDHKNEKAGNIAIEQIIKIAKTKMPEMLDKNLKKAVKSVVGTCMSLGILIDNKDPKTVQKEIDEGHYDSEIKEERTEVSEAKKAKLEKFFEKLSEAQERKKKAEEEAAAAETVKAEEAKPSEEGLEEEKPAEGTPEAEKEESKEEKKQSS